MLTQQLLKVTNVGGEWILWLLIVMSFLSVGAVVDRWLFYRRRITNPDAFGAPLIQKLQNGDVQGAIALCTAHKSVEADVIRRCLEWYDDGADAMSEVLEGALRDARPQLDKNTVLLGTIGNNAPFVGLLGTVLGVIKAFAELGSNAMGAMGSVMSGIAEALIATAVGILVAIPAVVAFNIYSARATDLEETARSLMNRVMAVRKSARGGPRAVKVAGA